MAERRPVVKTVDMSEEMQDFAFEVSFEALEKLNIEKDIALYIKKRFDERYCR